MTITVRILGAEVLHISTERERNDEPGDVTSQPVGFVASAGDQRWQKGPELA